MEIKSSADFVRMTREALAAAGFERREVEGTVYWVGFPFLEGVTSAVCSAGSGRSHANDSGPALQTADVTPSKNGNPTLVLIHGVNDQAGSWFTVAPALARTRRVILPDLPGHGDSAPRDGALPISLLVRRLDTVIARETSEPVELVGNSLGGWIAMLYTLAHPERVSRLTLEASGGLARPIASPMVAVNRDQALVILRNVHGPRYQPPEWVIEALLQRATDSPMLRVTEIADHYLEPRLAEIRVPTTVVWGADDGVVPRDYAEALRDGITGSTFHVIEGAAHIPHLQQPERFLACLTATS